MAVKLSKQALELIEGKNFGHFGTLNKNGTLQMTPVWVDHDGDTVLVNTAEGRVKDRNTSRDPRVALSIHDQENPYRWVSIRGKVIKKTNEGAEKHIDKLAKKYLGKDKYPLPGGQVRVIIKIKPDRLAQSG